MNRKLLKYIPVIAVILGIAAVTNFLKSGFVIYTTATYEADETIDPAELFDISYDVSTFRYSDNDTVLVTVRMNRINRFIRELVYLQIFNPHNIILDNPAVKGFSSSRTVRAAGNLTTFRDRGATGLNKEFSEKRAGSILLSSRTEQTVGKEFEVDSTYYTQLSFAVDRSELVSYGMPIRFGIRARMDFKGIQSELFDVFEPNYQLHPKAPRSLFTVDNTGYWSKELIIYPESAPDNEIQKADDSKILWLDRRFLTDSHANVDFADDNGNRHIDPSYSYSLFTQFIADKKISDIFVSFGSLDRDGTLGLSGPDSLDFATKLQSIDAEFGWIRSFIGVYGWITLDTEEILSGEDTLSFDEKRYNIIRSASYIVDDSGAGLDGIGLK